MGAMCNMGERRLQPMMHVAGTEHALPSLIAKAQPKLEEYQNPRALWNDKS